MRRTCLVSLCFSVVCLSGALAQTRTVTLSASGSTVTAKVTPAWPSGYTSPFYDYSVTGPSSSSGNFRWASWDTTNATFYNNAGKPSGVYTITVPAWSATYSAFWNGTNFSTNQFATRLNLQFSSEWAGKSVVLKTPSGLVVFSNVVAAGGSEISYGATNYGSFTNWDVFVDGVFVGNSANTSTWSTNGSTNVGSLNAGKGGPYAYSWDSTFSQSSWRLVRPDGVVVATGAVGDSGALASGIAALLPGQTAKLQLNKPTSYSEVGSPLSYSGFVDSGYTVYGNTTNSVPYSFANNSSAWRPIPVLSNPTNEVSAPLYSIPNVNSSTVSYATNSNVLLVTNVVTSGTNQTTNVASSTVEDYSVNVGSVSVDVVDDGEAATVAAATGLVGDVRLGVSNMQQGLSNLSTVYGIIQSAMPSGVGRSCTLQIGPYSLDLSFIGTSGIRTGLSYLVMICALQGFIFLLREAIS